ncbi:MAG: carbon storage regulator [Planctomycetes bacterium]|nr:carbon storage regulator [Planctomycetota bacterium]
MLVISRMKGQSLIINDNITVTVYDIRGDQVRLDIELPREMSVHRKEVYDAMRRSDDERIIQIRDAEIRRRIEELQRQIRELEAQLSTATKIH